MCASYDLREGEKDRQREREREKERERGKDFYRDYVSRWYIVHIEIHTVI